MKSDMPDSDVDYDKIKSSERRYVVLNGAENPYNIKSAINEFQRYSVTDVAIEYLKNISDKECENKEAEITTWWFSFERNKMLFEIKMQPGSVIIKDIDRLNYIIKLEFPKNQNETYPIWLSEVTIRFLNIITGKGDKDKYIRDTYATYLKDVQQYVQEQNCFEEEAFDYVKKPYVKKDDDKALKQKMMDVQDAIEDLCYCPIGSTPFVPGNARYVQKSYWQKFQNLTITTSRQYHERRDKVKKNVIALQFNSVDVSLFDIGWFKNRLINDLLYINVTIIDTSLKAWETFAECLSTLSILLILRISADLKEIPDIVFQRMPDSVTHLNLAFNRLKTISSYISRLKQLKSLYLDYNENLENDGIPWESLPISIETFSCDNTGLKTISQNIQRLVNLKDLKLTNCNIQNIPWASINSNIKSITGTFNDITEINSNNFPHLEILDIRYANIDILPSNVLPLNLKQLHVFNSLTQVFNITRDYIQLHTINLSNNKLATFPFEFMPVNLANLYLSHNLFEKLDLMEHWIKLKCLDLSYNQISIIVCSNISSATFGDDVVIPKLDLNLDQNKLQSLPIGFENYIQISELNIGNNPFVFEQLNDVLWNRLPKFLHSLTVDGLDLRTLPCSLKNYPLNDLSASNCNLHYICPQLSRQCQPFLFLDISDNSTLKHLPFAPKKVFPAPDKNEIDIECYDIQEKWNNFGGNELHPFRFVFFFFISKQ